MQYDIESLTLTEATTKRIQPFEIWVYRRMLRISWVDQITNKEVLRTGNTELELISTIKPRNLQYLGHIMRNAAQNSLPQNLLQAKKHGKRGLRKRRILLLKNLRTWFSIITTGLFRAAANKAKIAIMVCILSKYFA